MQYHVFIIVIHLFLLMCMDMVHFGETAVILASLLRAHHFFIAELEDMMIKEAYPQGLLSGFS